MTTETWKPVIHDADYEVSDRGRVRLSGQKANMPLGLRPLTPSKAGYVPLMIAGTKRYVHRLVMEAFVGICPPGSECHHLNGNRSDNRLFNLRWVTPTENQRCRIGHGTHSQGRKNVHAKLTDGKVWMIRAMYASGMYLQRELAVVFGSDQPSMSRIILGNAWKHTLSKETSN